MKTPEEEIRQKAIRYLIDKLDVPEEFIYVRLLHNSKNQVL